MGEVIELPTHLNMVERFREGHGVKSKAVDGSVVLEVGGVELWLAFEQAAVLMEELSDAVLDAFSQLQKEAEEKDGRFD